LNYEHIYDLQFYFGLVYILQLLGSMHGLIKFTQIRDVFAYDCIFLLSLSKWHDKHVLWSNIQVHCKKLLSLLIIVAVQTI
jgi:hypothetical protein